MFIDARRHVYLYNLVTSHLSAIPSIASSVSQLLWDPVDPGLFISVEGHAHTCSAYMYSPLTIVGEQVTKLGLVSIEEHGEVSIETQETHLPFGCQPLLIYDGQIVCQKSDSGDLRQVQCASHDHLDVADSGHSLDSTSSHNNNNNAKERLLNKMQQSFEQNLVLHRLERCWTLALKLDRRPTWLALAGKAMEQLALELATRVYRALGDAGMTLALEEIQALDDRNLVAGKIQLLFGDHARAQELLLLSSEPRCALDMRQDLLQWNEALRLATTLAPAELPRISASYGQQLEFLGENEPALGQYEQALGYLEQHESLSNNDGSSRGVCLEQQCMAGIARTCCRLGDLRRGTRIVMEMMDTPEAKDLCKECGTILENMKQFPDAAQLYEKGEHVCGVNICM